MSRYTLSAEADKDIEQIPRQTVQSWEWAQADTYMRGMDYAFETLARFPSMGRDVGELRAGY